MRGRCRVSNAIKCISLWQPWATAIANGSKLVETRHWEIKHRGLLLIHAAKKKTHLLDYETRRIAGIQDYEQLPLGALVAVADLYDCKPTYELLRGGNFLLREQYLGNYGDGRYGWMLRNVRALPEPIPYKGAQGLFDVPVSVLPEGFHV